MVISWGATRLIVNWSPGSKGKKSIPGSGLRRKRMVRRRLSEGWCQRAVIDGGAASGADPHFLFGCGPIVKTKVAPCLMWSWLNHGLFHGLPLTVADWLYELRSAEHRVGK